MAEITHFGSKKRWGRNVRKDVACCSTVQGKTSGQRRESLEKKTGHTKLGRKDDAGQGIFQTTGPKKCGLVWGGINVEEPKSLARKRLALIHRSKGI